MSETRLVLKKLFLPLVAVVLGATAALQVHTASLEAQTFDEAVHLTAGYSYWKTGDFRLNQEHPPFAKRLAALPLLAMGLRFDTASKNWSLADQSEMGREFLYTNTRHAGEILAAARAVTIGFSLVLALALTLWVRSRFGDLAGLSVLLLYAFDPNFIAHGRYVTTDVPAACLGFLSVIAWLAWLEHRRKRDLVFAALALGLSMATKFSAPYAIPIHLLLAIVQAARGRMRRLTAFASFAAVVVTAAAICLFTYGPHTFKGKIFHEHRYFTGLHDLAQHNDDGHPSFLLGKVNRKGDAAYFPVAFAVKSTEVTLIGLLLSFALLPRLWRRHGPLACLALLAYPIFYFTLSMKGQINIGVRHLLPIYPFLFALIAAAIASLPKPAVIASTAAVAVGLLAANSTIYPDYLAYFNQFAGGPAGGTRYLLDSNVDWGQDVKKLKTYMDAHDIPLVQFAYFGMADLEYYGVRNGGLPGASEPRNIDTLDNWVAVSVTSLYDVYSDKPTFSWLQRFTPTAKIGWSIYVYDLRQETIPAGKRPLPPEPSPSVPTPP